MFSESTGNIPAHDSSRFQLLIVHRTGNRREDTIGVRSDEPNRAHHDYQNNRQHDGVFGYVLSFFIVPKTTEKTTHYCPPTKTGCGRNVLCASLVQFPVRTSTSYPRSRVFSLPINDFGVPPKPGMCE